MNYVKRIFAIAAIVVCGTPNMSAMNHNAWSTTKLDDFFNLKYGGISLLMEDKRGHCSDQDANEEPLNKRSKTAEEEHPDISQAFTSMEKIHNTFFSQPVEVYKHDGDSTIFKMRTLIHFFEIKNGKVIAKEKAQYLRSPATMECIKKLNTIFDELILFKSLILQKDQINTRNKKDSVSYAIFGTQSYFRKNISLEYLKPIDKHFDDIVQCLFDVSKSK